MPMAGRDTATTATWVYRRRLAAAAAASLLLHLVLARVLVVTSLGLDAHAPQAATAPRAKPAPRVDFTIRVPKSPATRPAHERPLEIATARPAAERSAPARPAAAATPVAVPEPAERADVRPAAAPAPTRDLALAAAPAPGRALPSDPTAAATAAEPAADAAQADAAHAPTPAAASRDRPAGAAAASYRRPREVALLERLTAPVTERRSPAPRGGEEGLAATQRADRAAVDATVDAAAAEPDAAPVGTLDESAAAGPAEIPSVRGGTRAAVGPRAATLPRDRFAPRALAGTAGSTTVAAARDSREAAAGPAGAGRTAGRRANVAADPTVTAAELEGLVGTAEGAADAGPAPATGSARRGTGAALAGPRPVGGAPVGDEAGSAGGAPPGPSPGGVAIGSRGRGSAGEAAGGVGASRSPGRVAFGGQGSGASARADEVSGDGTAAAADARPAPGPQAVGLAADVVAPRPRLAAAAPSRAGAVAEMEEAGEAELSVALAPPESPVEGRRRDDEPLAGVRPPDRATVVTLPTETRVRDVAEAVARRGRDAPQRRADPRAARADVVIDRGLEFLARAQQADGRWCLDRFAGSTAADAPQIASDTAATGLAILSFLGAGHDHFDGPHRDTVRRGLEFLLSVQKPDGDLYVPAADELSNRCGWLYSHGIASIALCEAVGMTGDPLLRPAAARACSFVAASQEPELGGWRYAPRADADLSVSGWMLIAVRSGALAGVETDPRTLAGVRGLLDAAARPGSPARYAYDPRNLQQRADEMSGLCMTAVGTLMRLHTGTATDDPQVAAAARILAARRPAWDARSRDSYLWYYASQVLVHTGGPGWEGWYAALVDTLAATQETADGRAGSWNPLGTPPDRWGRVGGRIYVTALHLLALEVPQRRLPTYTAGE